MLFWVAPREKVVRRTLLDLAQTQEASLAAEYTSPWYWCNRCQALYAFANPPGVCPAGGAHDGSTSASYFVLKVDGGMAGPHQQPGWRICGKCQVLFYGPGEA